MQQLQYPIRKNAQKMTVAFQTSRAHPNIKLRSGIVSFMLDVPIREIRTQLSWVSYALSSFCSSNAANIRNCSI